MKIIKVKICKAYLFNSIQFNFIQPLFRLGKRTKILLSLLCMAFIFPFNLVLPKTAALGRNYSA